MENEMEAELKTCTFCGIRSSAYIKIRQCCLAGHVADSKRAAGMPTGLSEYEPDPVKNDFPAVWDLVLADIKERDSVGEKKYGTRLQPFNGRISLKDAYQEALDLVVYLRQAIYEQESK